ncbi:hypothetical protein OPT61_g2979 [Boeremia exigua]|uniref:Uncharacterized protein n=1 Tax=Boeremia exigua TaxID=749465 RepID=A0ACC2IJL3_9PLEO|nr:hypothetical protein OPT61_g2979 [Boeremia exigua]
MMATLPLDASRPDIPTANNGSQNPTQDGAIQILSSPEDSNGSQKSVHEPTSNNPTEHIKVPEASRSKMETAIIMGALAMSLFLSSLDTTIITTAVPTIVNQFDAPAGYVWIGSAYLLGNAAFVPVWGKVSDIFGRKQILLVAVGMFLLGSLLCAVSQNMGMLIAARAVQGVGGGGAIVLPNICISDLFPLQERGMYFGLLGTVWALASALGPVVGGVFTSRISWRWCFYINLPFGGAAVAVLVFFLKLHNPRTPLQQGLAAIDWYVAGWSKNIGIPGRVYTDSLHHLYHLAHLRILKEPPYIEPFSDDTPHMRLFAGSAWGENRSFGGTEAGSRSGYFIESPGPIRNTAFLRQAGGERSRHTRGFEAGGLRGFAPHRA